MVGLYLGIGILALFSRDIGTVIMDTAPPAGKETSSNFNFYRVNVDHNTI